MSDIIERLFCVLQARRSSDPAESYVASLHEAGLDRILEKIGEESTETIIAVKNSEISGDTADAIRETADLWFHTMVMLDAIGESPKRVFEELDRRFGTSGIAEKSSRKDG